MVSMRRRMWQRIAVYNISTLRLSVSIIGGIQMCMYMYVYVYMYGAYMYMYKYIYMSYYSTDDVYSELLVVTLGYFHLIVYIHIYTFIYVLL